jgi:hypothetical protein
LDKRFTADALYFMKQLQISPIDLVAKNFDDDFSKKAPSEDIALIRYQHYLIRRNSKSSILLINLIEKLTKLRDTM